MKLKITIGRPHAQGSLKIVKGRGKINRLVFVKLGKVKQRDGVI
jgi:hypothetical protein